MRVVFVLGTTFGGTGEHVRMLVEGMRERGHQVAVVGPRSVEESFGFRAAGARFVEIPLSDRPHPVADARSVATVRRVVHEADVVHAHGLRAGSVAALARVGQRRRAPLVVTLHNALTAGGLVGTVYGVLERIVARGADHVLAVAPDLGARMAALGARDVRPAVVPAYPPGPPVRTVAEVRAELGVGRRPVVLTVARLAQQKGLELLLDTAAIGSAAARGGADTAPGHGGRGSAAEATATDPGRGGERGTGRPGGDGPLFVIAGEGPLRGELQARIDAEALPVRLLGFRKDIPDLLAAATLVLWPSRWEGQPLSLSEALMAGRPVVATAVGGVPDLLGGAGTLVPYGDAAAMRAAVQEIVDDPAKAEALARAAARRGGELPGEADAVESVLAVYSSSRSPG
ncbi:glycosyltransferase [Nonomuraea longicatena]|uniref:Glycosyltransferase family 4 protein n=1 Tax=Nonomuraea longicatena TaxID=83682 RepID=A0ABP3ZFA1_9ACTN